MTSNRHRLALLTWALVYPMITGFLILLDPLIGHLVMPLRTLVLTAVMVPVLMYLAMPFATSRLRPWLSEGAVPITMTDKAPDARLDLA